jgi:integrating conjugative element protein (TIGR03755 family)
MKLLKTTIVLILLSTNTYAVSEVDDSQFFNNNSKLYYEIGGAKRISPSVVGDNTNINLGLGGNVNVGYSCGNFDASASFANLMNDFKNSADSVKNTLIGGVKSGIAALPLGTLMRANPGLYDMFQEYSADADLEIDIATKSCEQIESELVAGGTPYADFLQVSKGQDWKDKANSGDDIVASKKEIEENVGKNGIVSFGGKKVGGERQAPLQVIASSVGAGFQFMQGEQDPLADTKPDKASELAKYFKSKGEAQKWATDVLGEFEINNTKPISKVGLGLHSKLKAEQEQVIAQMQNQEFAELGMSSVVTRKLAALEDNDQGLLLANMADDMAIKAVIDKALIIRRALIMSEQEPNEAATGNKVSIEQRAKAIAKIDNEIKSLMFERNIKKELANSTIVKLLDTNTSKKSHKSKEQSSQFL